MNLAITSSVSSELLGSMPPLLVGALRARALSECRSGAVMEPSASTLLTLADSLDQTRVSMFRGASFMAGPLTGHLVGSALESLAEDSVILLDNACYEAWHQGVALTDAYHDRYLDWAAQILAAHPRAYALVPDVIAGDEVSNLTLAIEAVSHAFADASRFIPVWHPHESLDQVAEYLSLGFEVIAVGSSPLFNEPGSRDWAAVVAAAADVLIEHNQHSGFAAKLTVISSPSQPAFLNESTADACRISDRYAGIVWPHTHPNCRSLLPACFSG